MNKIEELEAQLMAERIKVQIDLKEKYKWVIGKYVKHDDSFIHKWYCSSLRCQE